MDRETEFDLTPEEQAALAHAAADPRGRVSNTDDGGPFPPAATMALVRLRLLRPLVFGRYAITERGRQAVVDLSQHDR